LAVKLAAMDWDPRVSSQHFYELFPIGIGPRRLGRSPKMLQWLNDEAIAGRMDVLHSHGVWQMNTVYPGWVARDHDIPLVCSPRGMLSQWSMTNGSRAKRVFWPLVQRPSLRNVACFHATAESEYAEIRALGFSQPVALIPNGIDIVNSGLPKPRRENERTLLFLGRLHPKKGLDLLLNSWQRLHARHLGWRLVVVGSDVDFYGKSGYLDQLQTQSRQLRLERISFVGELLGDAKFQAYKDAELFILPTYSENFGLTVAESLAAGTPAIVTKGAPWMGLIDRSAGWWVDADVGAITAALDEALSRDSSDLAHMGCNGRAWMLEEFSWQSVAIRMREVYEWLALPNAPTPSFVRVD